MLLAMAGAMSTAELGVSLAEMIRAGHVHAISATAANVEEDLFNLVAHDRYKLLPHYRDLSPEDEQALLQQRLNRVTDTCIPEDAMRQLEGYMIDSWREAAAQNRSHVPFEYFRQLVDAGHLEPYYQVPPADSWVIAACQAAIPVYTPGFEDSTLGNIFAARVIDGTIASH